jgi:hypothetical protein
MFPFLTNRLAGVRGRVDGYSTTEREKHNIAGFLLQRKKFALDKAFFISYKCSRMNRYSTRQAAKMLGIAHTTLAHYIEIGKVPAPESVIPGIRPTHVWTEEEIESLRQLLPKIANGRKTRYKKHSAISTRQSAKPKKK